MNELILVSNTDNPYVNHAIEDALLTLDLPYKTILFLWINRPSVIVGRNQNPWKEVHVKKATALGVEIIRRTSGGGTVYHDWGNLNYSFITHKDHYDESHNFSIIQESLKKYHVHTMIGPRKDMYVKMQKISGSAFYLKKNKRLHHGTLLVDVDTSLLWEVLRFNGDAIESRSITSKRSEVINLNQINQRITIEGVIENIKEAFRERNDRVEVGDLEAILDEHSAYIMNKAEHFNSWQWNFGETPKFKYRIGNKGYLNIKAGKVVETDDLNAYSHLIGQAFDENTIKLIDEREVKYDFRAI